jgi:chromatin segregation and condensation protein Rec8/ScpA/Scc1 (kleisin family)
LAWIPFITFVILTAFVVVNLIIAVICDAVHLLGDDSRSALGGIGSGLLSYEEEAREVCQKQTEWRYGTQQHNDEGVESGLAAAATTTSPRQQLSPRQSTIAAATTSRTRTQQRIKEIERKLDEMVMAQDQMRRTIEILSSRAKMMKMKALQKRKKHAMK